MMAPAGHVATTVLPVGADTHTVENSDGELARDALIDGDDTKPLRERDALTDRDATPPRLGERDALTERDGMKPLVILAVRDGDSVGVTIVHCT